MRAFRTEADGSISAELDAGEADILTHLTGQLSELVEARTGSATDPALLRLLPDAYPDDAEASAEFRRFTVDGLAERKLANASVILSTLQRAPDSGVELRLNPQEAQAWLRSLNDLRLTIGTRLGVRDDESYDSPDSLLHELYLWLGYVQQSLVEAMDGDL